MTLKLRVSENNGLPWTQTRDYINLCRTISGPGDPTTYNRAHPQGYSSTDVTKFQVGLASSNINNLPDVMYQLWPSKEWWEHTKSAKPLPKRDANGSIMYERTPRAWAPRELLDYPILRNLDTISSEEEAWFLEMLLRMDGRIEWTDLLMRMEYPGYTEKDEQRVRNRLQQRMARFREKFVMASWRDTAGDNNAIRDRVLDKLTPAQLSARDGLGSTRGSTPGSRDSQGRVIPVPGRRIPETAKTGDTTTHVQQQQQARSHVYHGSGTQGGSSTSQQNVQTNIGSPKWQYQTRFSPSSGAYPHRNRNVDTKSALGRAQRISISYTAYKAPQHYSTSSATPSHEATIPLVGGRRASNGADPRMRQAQASTVYAADPSTQPAENKLYAGASETLREPDQHSSDRDDWGNKDIGGDEGHDGDDEQENGESSENDDDEGNEKADVEMLSTEESPRMKSLTPEECCELERYLEEDRIRTQMCLNGMISVDELMLDMQNNEDELKRGLRRTRVEVGDDDEIKELQGRRAKRTIRGEGAAGSSNQPLSEFQESTSSGFGNPQPGPSGNNHRRGALVKTSRRPITRPAGSAVQRLHNDRLRRPPPKATVGHKDIYESLHCHQPEPVMDREWTVFHSHIDSQQTHYPPQHTEVEEGLYTNSGQRQGRLAPYESRQDNSMRTSNPDTSSGERQPSHRQAYQQPAASTVQDDPFYSDELFNGMLNGQPHNNHVGSIYARSLQQEIDEYYYRLMAPRPRPESGTSAPENIMPPPQRLRAEDPPTVFVADLLNPHSRPQVRQGGCVPQPYSQYNVPVAHAQSGSAAPVAKVTAGALQPANESDLAVGDITLWNPEWSAFINGHDAEPLLRAHHPDEYPSGSRPGTSQQ